MVLCVEDGIAVKRWPKDKMAMLLSRKQELEVLLAARNEELRKLCIQEAELTGVMPAEVPVEPGELPPTFRRRIGTAYTYPQNLINKIRTVTQTTDAESIAALELERQVQAGISEAALGLINKEDASKAVRRKNRLVYQQSQRKLRELEERLGLLTSRSLTRLPQHYQDGGVHHLSQAKCKKKPRPPVDQEHLEENSAVSGSSEHSSSHMRHMFQHDRLERSRSHNEPGTLYNAQMQQQLAPYQQYEAGLGGYWMSLDTGETVWCPEDNHWHREDKFSSLDRSKARPLQHKWSSPGAIETSNQKNSTCNITVPEKNIQERIRSSHHHNTLKNLHHTRGSPELADTWNLMRTQSMGSVDVTTVDESLCYRERIGSRKYKQKKWYETSLDGPQSINSNQILPYPNTSTKSYSQIRSTVMNCPSVSSIVSPAQQPLCHKQSKPLALESLQSSTSPRITLLLETNMDALTPNFNNSNTVPVQSPKNCTVIEPGQWIPYREVTKPFEMSDFYKYSTKFKNRQNVVDDNQHQIKANVQEKNLEQNDNAVIVSHQTGHKIQNLDSNFENWENSVEIDESLSPLFQKGVYQPLQPMKCQPYQYSISSNHVHIVQEDSDSTSWAQHSNKQPSHHPGMHKMCNNSNLNSSPKNSVNSRSTATLV